MKQNTFKIFLITVLLITTELMFAQTIPPSNRPPPPPGLPIDGGIFALITLAFGYAINKLRNKE